MLLLLIITYGWGLLKKGVYRIITKITIQKEMSHTIPYHAHFFEFQQLTAAQAQISRCGVSWHHGNGFFQVFHRLLLSHHGINDAEIAVNVGFHEVLQKISWCGDG